MYIFKLTIQRSDRKKKIEARREDMKKRTKKKGKNKTATKYRKKK